MPRLAAKVALGLLLSASVALAQTCPESNSDIINLSPFTACTVTAVVGSTPEEITVYTTSGADRQCLATKNGCAAALKYSSCATTTEEVIQFIIPVGIANLTVVQCTSVFQGYPQFCPKPFGEFVGYFCPTPPLLPTPAIIGIVIGGIFLAALSCFVCWRTKRSVALDKEIEDALNFMGPLPSKGLNSPNPALVVPPQKSIYYGVEWNNTAGGWDAMYKTKNLREWLGTFTSQELAARAYDQRVLQLRQKGVTDAPLNFDDQSSAPASPVYRSSAQSGSPATNNSGSAQVQSPSAQSPYGTGYESNLGTPPGLGYSVRGSTMNWDDPDRERHIQELIYFYQVYDPEKPDIEAHVLALFDKYKFKGIARAVLRKYGVLPGGWSDEYDATRSIAMSMAAKFFSPTQSGQVALAPIQQSGPSAVRREPVQQSAQSIALQRDPVPNF